MSKKGLFGILGGFIVGLVVFAAARMIFMQTTEVHYHANFGLFVNGERDKFSNFSFYEEIAACSTDEQNNPKHVTHMHDNTFDLVHVHDHAATWGGFFANLGYTLGNKVLVTDKGMFTDGQDGKKLQFLLNGKPVEAVQNRVIQDEDALLISYGNEDATALSAQ